MPEEPWITRITITCANPALRACWQEIEDELREIVARCGWDTRLCTHKLKEIMVALYEIHEKTPDMTKPPRKRFK